MKEKRNYSQDIAEIRSMMERSSKFLSLSGWAGIMAGIYALAGAWIAYSFFNFNPDKIVYSTVESGSLASGLSKVILLAIIILILAIGTAIFLSYTKANKKGEKVWNATSRRLLGKYGRSFSSRWNFNIDFIFKRPYWINGTINTVVLWPRFI